LQGGIDALVARQEYARKDNPAAIVVGPQNLPLTPRCA
jgi:hypothetical protein